MNGSHMMNSNQAVFPTAPNQSHGMKTLTMEQIDPSTLEDDSDSDADSNSLLNSKPGKKTKGRVKIKMEFIENKLRRYTTFSKRKTGIMKKAYELSTLTGTQVMLLVASETGHVYTFATRKLQPMITSESGKALIQTCLNSPDPPPGTNPHYSMEQRMNPTGFEETELSYAVSEEEGGLGLSMKPGEGGMKPMIAAATLSQGIQDSISIPPLQSAPTHQLQQSNQQLINSLQQQQVSAPQQTTPVSSNGPPQMQIAGLPPGAVLVPQGTQLIPVQQNGSQMSSQSTSQTVYRIPNTNQIVSIPNSHFDNRTDTGQQPQQSLPVTSNSTPATTSQSSAVTPGMVMYQTPQGIVYAPTAASLPSDRSIFNFSQQPTSLSVPTAAGDAGQQQIITIPVPVSLSNLNMDKSVLQFNTTSASDQGTMVTMSPHSAAKKQRK